jgi:uncharacterized membrane protein
MRNLSKISLSIAAIALAFSPFTLDWQTGLLGQTDRAEAKSRSGGRSSGGSFSGGSSGSRSSGSRSSGSSNRPTTNSRPRNSDPGYYSRPSYGYSSGYNRGYSSGSSDGSGFWIALIVIGGIAAIAYLIWRAKNGSGTNEADNDIVTVTQLQVALLAQDRDIQGRLSELTLEADMDTPEGRSEMLKESVLALLRSPENWSHVRSHSQIVKTREAAGEVFGQISMTERSKVETETLVNVGGKVRQKALKTTEEFDPGSYIIVTLLVGTANDRSLFAPVHTTDDLTAALQVLGSLSTDYLLILELLWNPQDATESLTADELLEVYPELVAIG